ncbi:MAG: superoxide dismutase [Oligoflexia bacterium]|nr:superoxide dismutase [Oligoflexia bacterium]
MIHSLPPLPYDLRALAPAISAETLEFHHGKHHRTYLDNLNKAIPGTEFETLSLDEIVRRSSGKIFNNAAQAWNHSFYWNCLSPRGGREPSGRLGEAIGDSFGSFKDFHQKFTEAAVSLFGSGWAWLALDRNGKLEVLQASNAGNPLTDGKAPLLVCDVWEHAYYIDYRNARASYIEGFWKITNWDFAASRYEEAVSARAA